MLSRRTKLVLATLLVASLTFVILDLRGGDGPFSSARAAISSILGGVQRGAATVFSPITGFSEWWSTQVDQSGQIRILSEENSQLRSELLSAENDIARAAELDALLRVASVGRYRVVPAEVIAVGSVQDYSWTVTIDAGTLDGVEEDMTVINGDGLVGRVLKVYNSTATVVLLVDPSSSVGGRVAGSQEIGIVSGTGRQNSLQFQLLDPLGKVESGDAIVTFGSKDGRPYAPGLPIGEVVDVSGTAGALARVATVMPFADVSQLSVVGVVVRPPREDPRDSVLPSRPAPVVSPSPAADDPASNPQDDTEAEPQEQETAATPVPSDGE
ncbi:MAG: rod shape-determining protein MreC [Candidatus Nanopelagicales bacterium]|nr:rod shape-determining protein MreC [Candidatus Nanopelagicales bacterium]MCF8539016.1 rod shape-determining protein MreC [Candidatus Nanopelagicales bacterium]MCF8551180.1 rod shape-determining protein MreC [Candidatus Nanopelagicales bacterium]